MHNTHMSQYIPCAAIQKTAGTWTPVVSTHLTSEARTANASAFTAVIAVPVPSNSAYRAGARLKSVDVFYKIATADASDFATAALKKKTLPAHGSAAAGADVAVTPDANHDTAAKRKAQGDHTLTLSLDAPAFTGEGEAYEVVLVVECAATTAFSFFGARANYELRV